LPRQDAIIIGSGPNGLTAAIELARAGWSVTVYEARNRVGGGARTAELTLPGFHHDICSAIHPLGISSPVFRRYPLAEHGLEWLHPELPLAHPFADGTAAVLARSFGATGATLGQDGPAWRRLFEPLAAGWDRLQADMLGPLRPPKHPLLAFRFARLALQPARRLAEGWFKNFRARSLFAGIAAHAMLPLEQRPTAAFGLVLGILGHAHGWPLPRGGSQAIVEALAAYLRSLGGRIEVNQRVSLLEQLPTATAILFDLTPRQIAGIAGHRLPGRFVRTLNRYRYGSGVFKIDWALAEPVPWQAEACRRAGTIHLGGSLEEIARSAREIRQGRISRNPYVLLAQQSLIDPSRAPAGLHTLWAYCHATPFSSTDLTLEVEEQIERFAPGFQQIVLARHTMTARDMERYNPNFVGGDIGAGRPDLGQILTRPASRWDPYHLPAKGLYICSAATPPGSGVHGLCGYHAARSVLRRHR
jgi:phytoene dehydrogenase-like protein